MQHKDSFNENKAWSVITDFFWSEAEFMKLVKALMHGLNGLTLSSSDKKIVNTLRDDLALFERINVVQKHLPLYAEIQERKLDFATNKEKQEAIAFIKEKFNGNLHQAALAMLSVINDKTFGYELDYIYSNSMHDEISKLETPIERKIHLEIDGRPRQLSNLTILGTQRYPRYELLLKELRKAYGRKAKLADHDIQDDKPDDPDLLIRKEIQHQIQNIRELNNKANSLPEKALFKMYIYLRKYEDKNKEDYRNRVSHFIGLIEDLMAANLKEPEEIMNKLKKDISNFSWLSLSTRYADLLRDLLIEIETDPQLLKENVKFLYNDLDRLSELAPQMIMGSPKPTMFSPRSFRGLEEMFFYLQKNPHDYSHVAIFRDLLQLIADRKTSLTKADLIEFFRMQKAETQEEKNEFSELQRNLMNVISNHPVKVAGLYSQLLQLHAVPRFKIMFPDVHELLLKEKDNDLDSQLRLS